MLCYANLSLVMNLRKVTLRINTLMPLTRFLFDVDHPSDIDLRLYNSFLMKQLIDFLIT
jgi:hypothetical protein